jgi:hypothetical protein
LMAQRSVGVCDFAAEFEADSRRGRAKNLRTFEVGLTTQRLMLPGQTLAAEWNPGGLNPAHPVREQDEEE